MSVIDTSHSSAHRTHPLFTCKIIPKLHPQVTELDLQEFRSIVGERVLTDSSDVEPYNVDWLRNLR